MKITKPKRTFVEEGLQINSWQDIESLFKNLAEREINSKVDLEKWLADKSELDAVLEENLAWRYINMTIDTRNENNTAAYTEFVSKIQPKIAPFEDKLNRKMMESPFISEFEGEDYKIFIRSIQTSLELYREENISIQAEISEKSQEFGAISGAQSIEYKGEQITMQKAGTLLKENDPKLRKEIFSLMSKRRAEDTEKLDNLFSELIKKRHQIGVNAGFENFRDYMFEAMGRFDYTKQDCFDFHNAIKDEIVPIVKKFQEEQASKLGVEKLKPWDTEVDPDGKAPLKPFEGGKELLDKSVSIFNKIDAYFGNCLATMNEMKHLDLESKEGKSPGGYNYPLYEIGVPFIFMNAVGSQRDVVTMVHEGGHAVHSFLSRDLKLTGFKSLPSEVAELASMSMELLTMEHWDEFYSDKDDLKRAKLEQLKTILKILPWIATIDEFQHWIYENPEHTIPQRHENWDRIASSYGTGMVDWTGHEEVRKTTWQRQLHLFEVPFYYIEYGISQLGALGVWKNSKDNHAKAIQDYKNALSLGYTKTIPEIYKTANISFDFSKKNVKELAEFVQGELAQLN